MNYLIVTSCPKLKRRLDLRTCLQDLDPQARSALTRLVQVAESKTWCDHELHQYIGYTCGIFDAKKLKFEFELTTPSCQAIWRPN